MKKFLIPLVLLAVVACKNNSEEKTENAPIETSTNSTELNIDLETGYNQIVFDESEDVDAKILLGTVDRKGFQMEPFNTWFDKNYDAHEIDMETTKNIDTLLDDNIDIIVFMGTWCEDSYWEIPALYKILDATKFNEENLYVTAVDGVKKSPNGKEEKYNIEYVPTIIFMKDAIEIGRFVEYANESLEKDIYAILSGADYKPGYSE